LFHIGDPEAQVQMSIQNEKDAIFKGALANLGSRRVEHSRELADQLGSRMFDTMLAELFVDKNGDGIPDALQSGQKTTIPGTASVASQQTDAPERPFALPRHDQPTSEAPRPTPDSMTQRVNMRKRLLSKKQ